MTAKEIIALITIIYAVIGCLAGYGAALNYATLRGILFAFACWPVIAWYGLRLLIERATK